MYYVNKIRFEDLLIVLKIYKKQGLSKETVLSYFSQAENCRQVNELYAELAPLNIHEAIQLSNAEQRMAALQIFSPEEIAKDLNAKVLDTQTIQKKQIRWDNSLTPYEHIFEDTYTLYEIKAEKLGLQNRHWWQFPNIYFVKCQCASTDRVYYLYVPPEVGKIQDAIEAIAWTMQINGTPISKAQYLNLMYSES
jgi:hypothetical protein